MGINLCAIFVLLVLFANCTHPAPKASGVSFSASDLELRKNALSLTIQHPFLWKITKSDATSYLFGSMHIGIEPHKDLPLLVWKAFWGSSTFVSEIDFAQKPNWKTEFESSDNNLKKELSAESWNVLKRSLGSIPESTLAKLPPTIASFFYEWGLIMKNADMPVKAILDASLFSEAIKAGKTTKHLDDEALLSNPNLFGNLAQTTEDLDDLLKTEPKEIIERGRRRIYELILAYKKGDLNAVSYVVSELADESTYTQLIGLRNSAWLPKLDPILSTGGAFIVVGAAHMTGQSSLLVLLRKQGYEVTRVIL